MLSGKKVLITGASGYLGSWMAEYARREGAHVRILLRTVPSYLKDWAKHFDVIQADITDRNSLAAACENREVVWHTASVNETLTENEPLTAFRVNVSGTYNILASAADAGVERFIKFSTFHVYGNAVQITENTPPAPRSMYSLTGFLSEECARYFQRSRGVDCVTVRISNGYGAPLFKETNRWTLVVNDLIRMAIERHKLVLRSPGTQSRDFVSIADVFQAVSRLSFGALQHDVFNVGGATSRSIMDVARLVQDQYENRYGKKIAIDAPPPKAGTIDPRITFDITRMMDLGYRPQDRLAGEIDRTFDLLES